MYPGESEFDIFYGNMGSSDQQKTFAVGINYASTGCGRTSQHISFADKINMNSVGTILEYGIRAIQTYTISNESSTGPTMTNQITSMSKRQYRIPFLVNIQGTVKTSSGAGVEGVTVTYCHIDRSTGQADSNPSYCPIMSLTTNLLGEWSGQILVSDISWTSTLENFYVTPFYNQSLSNNRFIVHTFSPASSTIAITHLGSSQVAITDTTSVSIFGSVQFDPQNMGGGANPYTCAFANVPVVMVQGNGQVVNTTSDSNGNFTFSVTQSDTVTVYIPDYNGNTWRSTMSVTGVETLDLSAPATTYSYTDPSSIVHDFAYNAITDDDGQWTLVLQKVNNVVTVNAGQAVINGVFQQFSTGNIKYIVNGVTYNYYQRLTDRSSFDLYTNFAIAWGSNNNMLNIDFNMYTTYNDLLYNTNNWQYCDYDNVNYGYPSNCGQMAQVVNEWTGYTQTSMNGYVPSAEIWIQVYPNDMKSTNDAVTPYSNRRLSTSESSGVTIVNSNSRCGKSYLLLTKAAGKVFAGYDSNIHIPAGILFI